mmetsp:Transcript_10533/g.23189  ORF Transcript_10533/g.23189 Transcript_10533/m.23189 type:complete len:597 (-) Transcript_10533:111-1901(-)
MTELCEFQRNSAYAAFILFVCTAALIYLTEKLSEVVTPLIWAAFVALPTSSAINKIEKDLLVCLTVLRNRWRRWRGLPLLEERRHTISFEVTEGDFCFYISASSESPSEAAAWLDYVNRPFLQLFCQRRNSCLHSWFKRRVTVLELHEDSIVGEIRSEGYNFPQPAVSILNAQESEWLPHTKGNALKEGWNYYVKEMPDESSFGEGPFPVQVKLFLDRGCREYPVSYHKEPRDEEVQLIRKLSGKLEVDRGTCLSWLVAFILSLAVLCLLIGSLVWLIGLGLMNFKTHLNDFKQGMVDLTKLIPKDIWDSIGASITEYINTALPSLVTQVTADLQSFLWQVILFLLYVGFWLSEPLPVNKQVGQLFQSYILLKSCVCLLFGCSMGLVMLLLGNPLWPLITIITALLNYVPEVGAVLSALLCLPAVLLNGAQTMHQRVTNTILLVVFGSIIKIITGNIIEVRLYSSTGGQFMRMHPVVLIALMMLCAAMLGLTGMFLSIPITATIKFYLLCADLPSAIVDPLLTVLEGDETIAYKNEVDACRAQFLDERRRHTQAREMRGHFESLGNDDRGDQEGRGTTMTEIEALRSAGDRPLLSH